MCTCLISTVQHEQKLITEFDRLFHHAFFSSKSTFTGNSLGQCHALPRAQGNLVKKCKTEA